MMLIGHSMGGLLSRLSISSSGQTLWNTASKVPPDQIEMEPELKDLLMQSLFFEPVPMVSRVVFVSTPHRGSPMGDELVGRLASRLIRVPKDILTIRETLAQYNGQADVSEAFRGTRYATGVAQLGLGNPVLQAINQLPMRETVPYHSIIGYNGKEPLPHGGRRRRPLHQRPPRRGPLRAGDLERPLGPGEERGASRRCGGFSRSTSTNTRSSGRPWRGARSPPLGSPVPRGIRPSATR